MSFCVVLQIIRAVETKMGTNKLITACGFPNSAYRLNILYPHNMRPWKAYPQPSLSSKDQPNNIDTF